MNRRMALCAALFTFVAITALAPEALAQVGKQPSARAPQQSNNGDWYFAVSGDSRNCGDVVMPAIAAGVIQSGASFYWHLGDYRAIYNFDEDMQHQPQYIAKPLTISQYLSVAWDDFIQNQILPFATTPVFLGIG